ncbi:MAG: RsmE family RNA methyltransferase [Acidimicrobiales bacterium]
MVFVDDLDRPVVDPDDHHHLAKALRLANGAEVTACDGAGRWCTIAFAADAVGTVAEVLDAICFEPPPPWELVVAFAPVKGDRPEWTVQKLTELGVDRIVPIQSERSVVRWDAKRGDKQLHKWRRIAREAAMQSRRVRLPVIDDVTSFASLVGAPDLALADPDGDPLGAEHRFVVIGPEGGWAPSEREGRALVALPGGVLRAETAALTAASIMALHRSVAEAKHK